MGLNNAHFYTRVSLVVQMVKESACSTGDLGRSLGWEDSLEEGMATHSSILAWRIPWTEEPPGYVHRVAQSDMTQVT